MLESKVNILLGLEKTLLLHSGTHKTASSYIQMRLLSNKKNFKNLGVKLLDIDAKVSGNKILPVIIRSQNLDQLKYFLKCRSRYSTLVYSAEQCTRPLILENRLEWFVGALESLGFKLRLAFFLRDQPDYINSMYIHSLKKFRHSLDISDYMSQCLEEKRDWFDYNYMFSSLLRNSRLDAEFLPYGKQFGDPFERLMALPGWLPNYQGQWLSSTKNFANEQPGAKGVYLALKVSRRLIKLGVDTASLRQRAGYVKKYIAPLGWSRDRYFGLKQDQIQHIRQFYDSSNNQFASKVWSNKSWQSVFAGQKLQPHNVVDENKLSFDEKEEMNRLTLEVIEDLRRSSPGSFPGSSP